MCSREFPFVILVPLFCAGLPGASYFFWREPSDGFGSRVVPAGERLCYLGEWHLFLFLPGRLPVMRQQRVELFVRCGFHALQALYQLLMRMNLMELASTEQRVDRGCICGGLMRAGKQVVLTSQCNGRNPVLHEIVVHLHASIAGEADQAIP